MTRVARRGGVTLDNAPARSAFRRALLNWYRQTARDLPWRRSTDPYHIWLSEVLLQQTRVETVRAYYERFVTEMPDVHALAAAPLDRVLKLWEGLGYYTRARNLHRAACVVSRERGGVFPANAEQWRALPGIGRYSAAAIASIAAGEPIAAVDGNVKRVLARLYADQAPINDAKQDERWWERAEALLARRNPGDFNQAMMELGARVCTPRKPACLACPVARWCAARERGVADRLPRRLARGITPHVRQAVALIEREGRVLLAQRPPTGLLGGLWEFPATTVDNGAPPADVLARWLANQLALSAEVGEPIATVRHAFTHRRLELLICRCTDSSGAASSGGYANVAWVAPPQLSRYALTKVTHKILAAVRMNQPALA